MSRALAIVAFIVAGCAEAAPTATGEVGPPESGWAYPASHAACAPADVAPRLHFAQVSHLAWMTAGERVALAETDVSDTRGAEAGRLESLALEGALRRIAPIAMDAAGHAEIADRLRAAPPIDAPKDVRMALRIVEDAENELPVGSEAGPVLATLDDGLRAALEEDRPPDVRCAEVSERGTLESRVAAAAIRAGAPRARITAESLALLERMADAARAGESAA